MRRLSFSSRAPLNLTRTVVFIGVLALAAGVAVFAGCGDSDSGGGGTSTLSMDQVKRPAPGVVEMIDSLNDITGGTQDIQSAPKFLDIDTASVAREGDNLKFTMELDSRLPDGPQKGSAVEWGFLLDNDQNGTPDWGIFLDLTLKDGWVPGVFNKESNQRSAGAQFPGQISFQGTTIVWTVPAAAIGSPESFKWFAYADATILLSDGTTMRAGDRIWEPAVPNDSTDWLPYP
jgi:hypothetical protein